MAGEIVDHLPSLRKGAEDFRYLLGRGYPRKQSLELVGNRYGLRKSGRDLLHRGVFGPEEGANRRRKLVRVEDVAGVELAVDGHNVLITVEAALSRKPLVAADDGFVRDISGVSSGYRMRDVTLRAVDLMMETLREMRPRCVVFLFDAPISRSGRLASYVEDCLKEAGVAGEARAVRVPERVLMGHRGIVATSDSAIVDRVEKAVDLAGHVIRTRVSDPWLIIL
ncbi:MAG: DUF434 domain-containing protein [Candidatus Aminicenantales bacterium]